MSSNEGLAGAVKMIKKEAKQIFCQMPNDLRCIVHLSIAATSGRAEHGRNASSLGAF